MMEFTLIIILFAIVGVGYEVKQLAKELRYHNSFMRQHLLELTKGDRDE